MLLLLPMSTPTVRKERREWNENEPDSKTRITFRDSFESEKAILEQGADATQSVARSTKMSPIVNQRITQTPGHTRHTSGRGQRSARVRTVSFEGPVAGHHPLPPAVDGVAWFAYRA